MGAMLGFVVGTALQLQQGVLWDGWVYGCLLALAPVAYALTAIKIRANFAPRLLLPVLVAGAALGLTGLRATVYASHTLDPALEGRDVLVTGVVASMPQRTEAGVRFRLAVESSQWNGQSVVIPDTVDVGWYGGAFPAGPAAAMGADTATETSLQQISLQRVAGDVRAGERWSMVLRLKAPHGSRNPAGFDFELWLWEQGVQATGYVRATPKDVPPTRIAQTWRHPVVLARQMVRDRIFAYVTARQWAGMIAALVVGDQNAIGRLDWDVFRATGVAHLVSISGLHITMFAWAAALVVGWVWRRSPRLCTALPAPNASLLGGLLLACLYALFSGWGVPAQRTCLMLATVVALRLSGTRWPWPHVWMLGCAVVVAMDPWALLQPGFWLSFVAVGILFATDSGARYALSTRLGWLNAHVLASVREQWVVTVALTPLTLLLFGQVSLVGMVANAVAIPWITLVVTPLAMFGSAMPALWDVAAAALELLFTYLQWLSQWPWASVTMAIPPWWVGASGLLAGVLMVAPLPWSVRALALPLALPLLLWRTPAPPVGEFELIAADIGQGNAVLVRTAHHALLYDAGPRYSLESDAGHRVLVPLLQALHIQLDRVVLSHRDTDHVGGAAAVLAMQAQADVLSSVDALNPVNDQRPIQRCVAGQSWMWDGVRLEVLHPQVQDYTPTARSNALSCVLRISNSAGRSVLLAGDIEQAQEARLVDSGATLASDVLLVPHHGSKTSSSAEFLDAVQPKVALVQSGYRNRFGHPALSVVQRYRERDITLMDSPHCGAYTWGSWHEEMHQNDACIRQREPHYWSHAVP